MLLHCATNAYRAAADHRKDPLNVLVTVHDVQ